MDINYILKLLIVFIVSALMSGLGIVLLNKSGKVSQFRFSLYESLYDFLSFAFDLFIIFFILTLMSLIGILLFKN